jgi:hypothetical protein
VSLKYLPFTPDSSVRINIVGHSEALEQVGARKLANYTDQLVRHYKIDSIDTQAYLNRAAGKTNFPCSSSVAIILVSGCLPNNAWAASLVTLSSPMDKIMLYLFLPLLKLANYTDQLVRHYKIDSIDTQAYLNRAALVGCKNQLLSENYAKQLLSFMVLEPSSFT